MILVTGGAYQGKTEFAGRMCNKESVSIAECTPEGIWLMKCLQGKRTPGKDDPEAEPLKGYGCKVDDLLKKADVILHVEQYIKQGLIKGQSQGEIQARLLGLLEGNPEVILTAAELGCGIVPMDAFDRRWREASGRICCVLANQARKVYRVFCGIGTRIK